MTKQELDKVISVMITKAKAMQELSQSTLCMDDTKLDIESIRENPKGEYVWMLRTYGTHLINLKSEGVYQFDIDAIRGFNYNQKIFSCNISTKPIDFIY